MNLRHVRRSMDAAYFNSLANHPSIRPFIGLADLGELDFTAAVENPRNVCIAAPHGGWLFEKLGPELFEVHSFFLPEGRNKQMIAAMRETLRWMFVMTDAKEIATRIPDTNKAAKGLALTARFSETFRMQDTPFGPCSFWKISLDKWVATDPELIPVGYQFHHALDKAMLAANHTRSGAHPDEEAHERAVGACMLMVINGNPQKGVWLYNRWARLAGYQPIALLSEIPPVLDVVDAIVGVRNGSVEVFRCQEQRSQG